MSERYGTCLLCKGKGFVLIPVQPTKLDILRFNQTQPTYIKQECSRCGGTGFNGSCESVRFEKEYHV